MGSEKQERFIKILMYTKELANLIKDLLLKIKSPTLHNPTENIRFAPFHASRLYSQIHVQVSRSFFVFSDKYMNGTASN